MNLKTGHSLVFIKSISPDTPTLVVGSSPDKLLLGCDWRIQVEQREEDGTVTVQVVAASNSPAYNQIPEFFAALDKQKPRGIDEVIAIIEDLGGSVAVQRE
ncbi:hypothetical protein ACIP5Y_06975 [Nocardia sp. NPDC088792]|uniref:hypothetical protein n=1 Tax=Nocardia sp. NPDC088792 TaxID=3364332 RepID=UPI00380DBF21